MLTLYDCAGAPSPRRARILLAEKGVRHATLAVDLRAGEQYGKAYSAINPWCTVPALRTEDGAVLTDNAAIAAYLEARFPQPALLGETALEKAEVASWNWRAEFEGLHAVMDALRNSSKAMSDRALPGPVRYAQIPQLTERGLKRIDEFFAMLDRRLEGREVVATDRFTVADITAAVAVDFARVVHRVPGSQFPHVLQWRVALGQRPSFSL